MTKEFRREVLDQLKKCGSAVSEPHEFDFYLYLPTQLAAKQAAQKVRESEFAAKVSAPARKGDGWLCLASVTIVPKTAPLSEIGDFFDQLAAALGGEFDGWEASVKA